MSTSDARPAALEPDAAPGFYGSWPPTAAEGRMADALARGERVPGGPGACTCGHLTIWHGDHGRYQGRPCRQCECRAFQMPALPGPYASSPGATLRICAWCKGPIPAGARRDAVCCSVRCRQARHRFNHAVGRAAPVAGGRALRLAYADPPYPGKARLYRGHPDYAGEVDHAALIRRLTAYDGWALSTSAAALPAVLALCPPGVRVAAWHRGERATPSRWPLNAWEPVIYHGGRPASPSRGDERPQARRTDSLVHGVSPLTTLPARVIGAKPAAFCRWMFGLLGAAPGDALDDLFPGSGAVTRAWEAFTSAAPEPSRAARARRVASLADERDASAAAGRDASGQASAYASRPQRPVDASGVGELPEAIA